MNNYSILFSSFFIIIFSIFIFYISYTVNKSVKDKIDDDQITDYKSYFDEKLESIHRKLYLNNMKIIKKIGANKIFDIVVPKNINILDMIIKTENYDHAGVFKLLIENDECFVISQYQTGRFIILVTDGLEDLKLQISLSTVPNKSIHEDFQDMLEEYKIEIFFME